MKTCKTCKHWKKPKAIDVENDRFKICGRIKFDANYDSSYATKRELDEESVFDEPAVTVDGSGYFAELRTQESFGCTLHEDA